MKHVIDVNGLSFSYPNGAFVFDQLSFQLNEGEMLGIVGPNGTGKTTLLLLIGGLLRGEGTISILDQLLSEKTAPQIRKSLSFVFQNPDDQLFMPTVYEDVAFGLEALGMSKKDMPAAVEKVLDKVDLKGFENKSSHHLSLGQKKRICLAAALARNARLMLFDEPTNELDPGGRRDFIALLKSIPVSKIIVSHDLNMIAETCDRVIVLNDHRIIAIGDTCEILSNQSLMMENRLEVPPVFWN